MALQLRRRRVQQLIRQSVGAVVVVISCVYGLVAMTRHVLSERSSTSRVLIETSFSSDSYLCEQLASSKTSGGIVLDILALGYIFVSLAIICDVYFVSALEKISHTLALPPDVAGATFMAAGSSAPELFVSLADSVLKKPAESMGVGTVVGSAIFNILIIISLSGLLAGQVLKLDWRPLLRDSLWYTWAIFLLAFAVWDGSVDVLDSVIMVCSYASYIGYMAFSERVVNFCCKHQEVNHEEQEKEREMLTVASVSTMDATLAANVVVINPDVQMSIDDQGLSNSSPVVVGEQDTAMPRLVNHTFEAQQVQHMVSTDQCVDTGRPRLSEEVVAQDQLNDVPTAGISEEPLLRYFNDVLVPPAGILPKTWFVFTWPIVTLARITIPDCRYPAFSGPLGVSLTFVVSIVWMGVLSHYTVAFGTKFGCAAGIPSALIGLTIIAAGTSVPDALSSVLVARAGHGDMAVSNALGSNVFDILFGLGLPFLLSNLVYGEPVPVSGDDLDVSIVILFAVLLFVVVVMVFSRWRLYPHVCVCLLVLYATYVVFSYLRGLAII